MVPLYLSRNVIPRLCFVLLVVERHWVPMEHVAICLDLFSNTAKTGSIRTTHLPRHVPILRNGDRDAVPIHLGPEGGQVADEVIPVDAISNWL